MSEQDKVVEYNTRTSLGLSPTALTRRIPVERSCYTKEIYSNITRDKMARRNEDFDEFCDPSNPRIIKYEDVVVAAQNIKKITSAPTPCIESHYEREYGMTIYFKLETVQTTGSFKERGALNALEMLPTDKKKIGVVVASLGNQAMGICYYGQKLNIPVTVVMPTNVPIQKMQKCHSMGAKVIVQGDSLVEAQKIAKQVGRDKGLTFINGRDYPNIIAGYGTIAIEILEQVPAVDAILVPVGSGGLVAAILAVIKHVKPECLVYGVQPEVIPTFFRSLEAGERLTLPWQNSLADSIAMSAVGVNSFNIAQPLLDKMLLVKEDWIARSVLHLVEKERVVVEGAGACTLAAILGNLVPEFKTKKVVCIASGGNIDTILLSRCLERGLAAEGRLVKFKVGIRDSAAAQEQLLRLLAKGRYNVLRQFYDRIWMENDIYRVEVKLVCETSGLEHALELKSIIERAYPSTAVFENEPFNDTRNCPCFVRKC